MHTSETLTPALPAVPRRGNNLLSSRRLLLIGLLLIALLVAAVVGIVVYEHQKSVQDTLARHELLARVLEDHATRTIDSAVLAAADVSDLVQRVDDLWGAETVTSLRQILSHSSLLRGLVVAQPDGLIVVAAGVAGTGAFVDLEALGPLPGPNQAALLGMQRTRGLPLVGAGATVPEGLSVLPYARRVPMPDGGFVYAFVLLNPDAFANFQEQTLGDPRRAAALVGYDGKVIASTVSAALRPGQALEGLPPLQTYLPATERASWVGAGLVPGERMAAFRALRQYPLWVIVDMDLAQATAATVERVRWFAVAGAGAALMLLVLTLVATREQRARETDRLALDRVQAALAARGRELDGVFASVRELLFRTDASGVVELINARWELASGRSVHEAQGQTLAALVAPQSRQAVAELFDAQAGGAARHAEAVVDAPNGRTRRFELTVVPLFEAGRLTGFAGSGVDVTELLAVQTQLRSELAFNAAMVESHPLPVVVRDTMNRYVRVNRAWEAFFGLSRDQVIGTLASLTHGSELARIHEAKVRELLERGDGDVRYGAQALRSDGQVRDVFVSMALIRGKGDQAAGIVSVFMDVSEFQEAERTTRLARDAAESASSAKTEFIASVSHELRTPLQSILGFSEIGSQRPEPAARARNLFGDIHQAGQRMLALVNDLLDLSKLDRQAPSLETSRQDVRALIRDVVAEVQPLAQGRSVQVQVELAPAPLVAQVDGARLAQVIRNLLANAIRLSPAGQVVEVRAQPQAAMLIELCVADRGPGIPVGEIERIFDPFVQSSITKGQSGSTGLGLAISQRIVQAHGGRIAAHNRDGGGAVFTVLLEAVHIGELRPST